MQTRRGARLHAHARSHRLEAAHGAAARAAIAACLRVVRAPSWRGFLTLRVIRSRGEICHTAHHNIMVLTRCTSHSPQSTT
eukprot:scaffold142051_cov84-Phaeocystis_antarctica.AAC.3